MQVENTDRIRRFIEKWDGHITEDFPFAKDCESIGFEMDSGTSLKETFPDEEITSPEVLQHLSSKITDVQFLGTAIYSFWRYRTHWCDGPGGGLNENAQQWLKIAFARLRELLEIGSTPQKKYPHKMTAGSVVNILGDNYCPPKANWKNHFFKAEKGGYGEGDHFCGVSNVTCRQIVKEYKALPLPEVEKLIYDTWHEARLCGLLILVEQYKKGHWPERTPIIDLYIKASTDKQINNWDLVDLSAPGIVGLHELLYHTGIIRHFSTSKNMWKNRIAVVATLPLIKKHNFDLTFELVKAYLSHPHDLMHKACGWMLREIGKRDQSALTSFLNEYRLQMPRTMLRYAIEHYPAEQRRMFMQHEKIGEQ